MDIDIILKPVVLGAHSSAVYILNNEREISNSMPFIIGASILAGLWFNA
jgi:hypothetical protein